MNLTIPKLFILIILISHLFVSADDFDMGFTEEELVRIDADLNGKMVVCDGSGFKAVDNPLEGLENGNLLKCLAPQDDRYNIAKNVANQFDSTKFGVKGKAKVVLSGDFSYKKYYEGADCNCYPKNKLDEFLLQDYGKDGFDKKFKDIKNKTKTAYISNMRGTFQDMIDFEIFLSQNKIAPDDKLLVELKNCNINQYKKNIGIKIKKLCGLNPKEADSTISKILPDFLDKKIESIIKNEKIENSCLDYKTYKNATQASEYRTLFTILNDRSRNWMDIASIMQTSLNVATDEEYGGVEIGMGDIQKSLRSSFITRYFLFNKDKFINDERFIKYAETGIPTDKELLEFANDVKSVILKDVNIKEMAGNIGKMCNDGIKNEVIQTAFCPKENEIPNSIYENLEKNNIVKIKKYCSPEVESSNEMGEMEGLQVAVSADVEAFFDAKKNLFSSEKLFKKATAPKKAIIKALCSGQEGSEIDMGQIREEATWENFGFLNISYGICFKSQDECEKHGYKPKYSNDPTTLESFCKVTTDRLCEIQVKSVKMYIENDPKLNKSQKKLYDIALDNYRNKASSRLMGVVAGISDNEIGISAFDLKDIETSIKMINDEPILDNNIQPVASAINIQSLAQESKPSAIADYALRGSEDDFNRIVNYENDVRDGKISDGPIYERKISVPTQGQRITNTSIETPVSTSESLVSSEVSPNTAIDNSISDAKINTGSNSKNPSKSIVSAPNIENNVSEIISSETTTRDIVTNRVTNDMQITSSTKEASNNSEVRKLESSIDEIKKLQNQLEREEMDKISSSSGSTSNSQIDDARRRIEDLSRQTNEVATRAMAKADEVTRARTSNNIASNNTGWNPATASNISTAEDRNQSVAPSSLSNLDNQAQKIADDIKNGAKGEKESGDIGEAGAGAGGGRSPASLGGASAEGGALGGGNIGGGGSGGKNATGSFIDKLKMDETQFKKVIEESMIKNASNKEDILKALGVIGKKLVTIDEKKVNDHIEYTIREYDLVLTDNLKKFFEVENLSTIANREKVNSKFIETAKDEEKNYEILSEIFENYVVVESKTIIDKAKGLAYKGSIISRSDLTKSISEFYGIKI